MKKHRRSLEVFERRYLLMIGDTLAVLLAVLMAFVIWMIVDGHERGLSFIVARVYWFPILAGLWLALASANDFYHLRIAARINATLTRLVQITLQLWVLYLLIFFISPRNALPRLFILYYGVLSLVLIALWRVLRLLMFQWIRVRRRAVIVTVGGFSPAARAIADTLTEEAPDVYQFVGSSYFVAYPDLFKAVQHNNASEIILVQGKEESTWAEFKGIMDCYEQGVSIIPMPLLYEQITGRVPVDYLTPHELVALLPTEGDSIFDPYPVIKRGMDVGLALIGLAIFAALLPGIALALWLDSPGPIFFRQERVGRGSRLFNLIKLRSMIPDAERDTGPQWATRDDPRITRVGKVLRRTRLDEVPQLVNVLRGEMSLIGPRPERPEFVAELSRTFPFYRARHAVKPGITGWAQVRHPYTNTAEDALIKLQYDLYYLRHRSLSLDLLILLRTAGRMVSFKGQ